MRLSFTFSCWTCWLWVCCTWLTLQHILPVTYVADNFCHEMLLSLGLFCLLSLQTFSSFCQSDMFIDLSVKSSRINPTSLWWGIVWCIEAVMVSISASELIRDTGLWESLAWFCLLACCPCMILVLGWADLNLEMSLCRCLAWFEKNCWSLNLC